MQADYSTSKTFDVLFKSLMYWYCFHVERYSRDSVWKYFYCFC